ncbi:hypothetical protein CPT_Premi_054 [Proteus phage Premi]|uniref:Uncharacterized protein n=1 Tax=Proteus phage Premi TaxID=3097470 RepID=A0ABZ0ZYW3_9CAUD|nr:hypothetical protein CPT_Premi_054 [Proteus phage Premi]
MPALSFPRNCPSHPMGTFASGARRES